MQSWLLGVLAGLFDVMLCNLMICGRNLTRSTLWRGRRIAFLAPPSYFLDAHWALLESPFRDGGGAVELLGHPLGPKWSQKHQDKCLKSDLGSSRGGQGVSEALNASILKRFSSLVVLFWVLLHVIFVRKVLCIMVAASHCNCFSQCVERGRGSAAGAAEDHMTCMLDALQCLGLYT